jgi:hypothetical protein
MTGKKVFTILCAAILGLVLGCVSGVKFKAGTGTGVFFDDFTYQGNDDENLKKTEWTIRTREGGPGVPGCLWKKDSIGFIADPDNPGNRLLQLESSTDGTANNTVQAEFEYARKFFEGTYAARVFFNDKPVAGPGGDAILQTFFTISHLTLDYPLDPEYSEIDFEYLPNGGWGDKRQMDLVAWETYQEEPWIAKNQVKQLYQSFSGWHILVLNVSDGTIRYFIDGILIDTHGGKNYPDTRMSIHFNQWFINGGLIADKTPRKYQERVDWVFCADNRIFSPQEVADMIASYRKQAVSFIDTVPAWQAPPKKTPPVSKGPEKEDPANPRPFQLEVKKTGGITVDGNLGDWKSGPFMTLSAEDRIVYRVSSDAWKGPSDFSAKLYAGWEEGSLLLAAEITDNMISQDATGAGLWAGDYLELQFDAAFADDYSNTVLTNDDFQLGISPGNFGSVPKDLVVFAGEIDEAKKSLIQYAIRETPAGYIVELRIPSGVMKNLDFQKGAVFGMNMNPSDCDGKSQPQKLMMSTSPMRTRTNPTTYGKITLVE